LKTNILLVKIVIVIANYIFSSPEPKAQVSYCHRNLSGVRPFVCPSVCPSVNLFL